MFPVAIVNNNILKFFVKLQPIFNCYLYRIEVLPDSQAYVKGTTVCNSDTNTLTLKDEGWSSVEEAYEAAAKKFQNDQDNSSLKCASFQYNSNNNGSKSVNNVQDLLYKGEK